LKSVLATAALLLVCARAAAFAQPAADDTRTQYPKVLQNSYITINAGAIDQPFSQAQLAPGFHAASIDVPRVDVRVVLFGHEFNRFVSAQASYMRPLNYVTYTSVRPGDAGAHHVRVNFGAVTLKGARRCAGGCRPTGKAASGSRAAQASALATCRSSPTRITHPCWWAEGSSIGSPRRGT